MYPEPIEQLQQAAETAVLGGAGGDSARYFGRPAGRETGDGAWGDAGLGVVFMANQLLSIQESERKRIASDLHDGVGQSLTLIKFSLSEIATQLASGAIHEASESLQRLKVRVHGVLDEVRHAAMDLRPPMLDDLGILATLSWFFRELEAACPGMKVERDFGIQESAIPEPLKITIFRIIQEASSNSVKYANADRMRVSLKQTDGVLHFSIEDNGNGFDPAEVAIRDGSDRGLGLLSMKERANLSGGVYTMHSVAGKGTRIQVSWPFGRASAMY